MPSFRADVKSLLLDGSLIVKVVDGSCNPASLGVVSASVNAFSGSGSASGVCLNGDAVTFFPKKDLKPFEAGNLVEISWTGSSAIMNKPKIKKIRK